MLSAVKSKALLWRAGVLMMALEVGLRGFGYIRCQSALTRIARILPFGASPACDPELAQHVADIVDRATVTTSLYPTQCLARSLALHYFLLRYGQQPSLVIGVQTITGAFRSHAWVECDGVELNEPLPARELYEPIQVLVSGHGEAVH